MQSAALDLFTRRHAAYERWIYSIRYPEAVAAYLSHSPVLASGLRVLDAGCGTGVVTLALREALAQRGLTPGITQAFDLTPAMIERFRTRLRDRHIEDVEIAEANVLELDKLPAGWDGYDLILSASMMEYLPRSRITEALRGLRARLRDGGRIVLIITRPNWYTVPVIGWLWRSNLYTAAQLRRVFRDAGFAHFSFNGSARLIRSQHIVEAVR